MKCLTFSNVNDVEILWNCGLYDKIIFSNLQLIEVRYDGIYMAKVAWYIYHDIGS